MVTDRICKHLTDLELLKEALIDTEDEEGKTECKDEKKNMVDKHKGGPVLPKFMLSFRDFEDTIRSFNSDDEYPVEKWLSDFEDNSTLFGWTEIQKLLFAKKSLSGLAKLFVTR